MIVKKFRPHHATETLESKLPVANENEVSETEKEVNQLMGVLLFVISVILTILTVPVAIIIGTIFTVFKWNFGEYYLQMATSIDQLGNVALQHITNYLCITDVGYPFGDRDETISSVLGKNQRDGTLTNFGKFIVRLLDFLDPNHSLSSIDYFINSETVINTEEELLNLREQLSYKFPNVIFDDISIKEKVE